MESESLDSISASGRHSDYEVWDSACLWAENSKSTGTKAGLADLDGVFGYVGCEV